MIRYTWRVYGKPRAQPRGRAAHKGKKTWVYDPGTANAWKAGIKAAIANDGYPKEPLSGPVTLSLIFRMPRPMKHFVRAGLSARAPKEHTQKPDFDNLAKAVCDAMTDLGVWCDDSQIIHCEVHKRWSAAEDAGVEIQLRAPH